MATKIDAVWDKDKEISMLRKALDNADKELQEMRNKYKEDGKEKESVKVSIGDEKTFKELYKQEHAERVTMWHSVIDLSKERDILRDKWLISNSEVISCISKIESLKDMLRTSAILNVILGITTVVFAYFTNI